MEPVQDWMADPGDGYPESPSCYFDFDAFEAHYSGEESDQPDTSPATEPLLQPSEPEAMIDDDDDELSRAGTVGSPAAGRLLDMAASAAEAQAGAEMAPADPADPAEPRCNEPYDLYALEAQVAAARSRYRHHHHHHHHQDAYAYSKTPAASPYPSQSPYQSPYGPPPPPSKTAVPEKENWEAGWAAGMSRDRAIVRAGITAMHRRIREAGDCVITDYGQYMMLCEQQRAATDWHQIAVKETNMMQALYRGSLT